MLIKDTTVSEPMLGTKEHKVYRFKNNYGASIVRGPYTYGGSEGLYELAVIEFDYKDDYRLVYDTPITEDVIGHLTWEEVESYLTQIEALK
jgi:hypothetical protein